MLEISRSDGTRSAEDGAARVESPGIAQSFYKLSERATITRAGEDSALVRAFVSEATAPDAS
jgi:hypothetical protein